jgi:hypothetical protein
MEKSSWLLRISLRSEMQGTSGVWFKSDQTLLLWSTLSIPKSRPHLFDQEPTSSGRQTGFFGFEVKVVRNNASRRSIDRGQA